MFETLAKNRYDAFIRGIQFIGARIPTQAMQSFMPFEVICFLDDDQNKAYVPKANTHIEGSDYDIDKLYLLAMTILEGGKLASGSNIQSIVGYNVASKLEVAAGTFSETTTNSTRNIVKDSLLKELTESLDEITSQKFISFVNRAIRNWGLKDTHVETWLPDLTGTNYTTAKDLTTMLYNLDNPSFLNISSREYIVDYMSHVKNNRLIQAGLGKDALFVHKTGDIGTMLGDAGIVYMPNNKKYAVVILANRPYNSPQGVNFIKNASKIIYDYMLTGK